MTMDWLRAVGRVRLLDLRDAAAVGALHGGLEGHFGKYGFLLRF
jgi:hypothetical protein